MDVLYHRKVDDKKALSEIYRVLKPEGFLLLRVPANPLLFSLHDRYVHTRERYTKRKLLQKIRQAGFEVQKVTFVNSFLFIPARIKILFEKLAPDKSVSSINPAPQFLNEVILRILSLENLLLKRFSLPFGIGLFAVAKKRKLA